MEVIAAFTLGALAIAAGIVAAWPKLRSDERRDRILGWGAVTVLILATVIKTGLEVNTKRELDLARSFTNAFLPEVDEASGAAIVDGYLYVVHDEHPRLHIFEVDHKPIPTHSASPRLVPCDGTQVPDSLLRNDGSFDITELEGVAEYQGDLLLVSSHSPTREGIRRAKRELLVQVDISQRRQPCVKRHISLYPLLEKMSEQFRQENGEVGGSEKAFNTEALAITPHGKLFLGLRSPVVYLNNQPHSIVLVTSVEDAFARCDGIPRKNGESLIWSLTAVRTH
jgi:hypothetical protein